MSIPEEDYKKEDYKKDDFRRYLDRNEITDALTKVLVSLYEEAEKPAKPIDYIKQFLGGPSSIDINALLDENRALKAKIVELEEQLNFMPPEPQDLKSDQNGESTIVVNTSD